MLLSTPQLGIKMNVLLLFAVLVGLVASAPKVDPGHMIIGGTDVLINTKWPWQGQLLHDGQFICGLSLIGQSTVVTAAHCTQDKVAEDFSISLGVTDQGDKGNQQIRQVATIHYYNQYTGTVLDDIVVLKVDLPFDLNSYVSPVELASTGESFMSATCMITGFGLMNGGVLPTVMQQAPVDMITLKECRRTYRQTVLDTIVCFTGDSISVCSGDSGGPVVCQHDADSPWKLVGDCSFSDQTCTGNNPSGYTDIRRPEYQAWILPLIGITPPAVPTTTKAPKNGGGGKGRGK